MIFITRPMSCFHAENAHFPVHFLTCEEGFIAFLNISVRQVKKYKTSNIVCLWSVAGIDFAWYVQAVAEV